jgi:hypothetical protein
VVWLLQRPALALQAPQPTHAGAATAHNKSNNDEDDDNDDDDLIAAAAAAAPCLVKQLC